MYTVLGIYRTFAFTQGDLLKQLFGNIHEILGGTLEKNIRLFDFQDFISNYSHCLICNS